MTDPTEEPRILDLAKHADRSALFAALQAAMLVIVDLAADAGRITQMRALEAPVRRALEVGDTLGSPADLAARDRGEPTGHERVREALQQPTRAERRP